MSLSRETLLFLQLREEEREAFEARANRAPEVVWTTIEGEEIPIDELENGHLMNCIGICYKSLWRDRETGDPTKRIETLLALDSERKRRGLYVSPTHETILKLVSLAPSDLDVVRDFILQFEKK